MLRLNRNEFTPSRQDVVLLYRENNDLWVGTVTRAASHQPIVDYLPKTAHHACLFLKCLIKNKIYKYRHF